jgi:hypothetical protein
MHDWFDDGGPWCKGGFDEELVVHGLLGLDAFLEIPVEASAQEIYEVIEFSGTRSVSGYVSTGFLDASLERAAGHSLLFDLADERLGMLLLDLQKG